MRSRCISWPTGCAGMARRSRLPALLAAAWLGGCAEAPREPTAFDEVARGIPRAPAVEPRSRYGNPVSYVERGERYFVMARADGHRERGLASWYGRKFHGRKTSNGEIFDMHLPSAAHKTLPLPSWVEVTHLRTGRRITVRVNDRGPFIPGRIIDLSYRAARELGMVREGVAPVAVRVLAAPAAPARTDRYAYLQLGAFRKRTNAERFLHAVRRRGIDRVALRRRAGAGLNLVVHGPLPRTSLEHAARALERAGIRQYTVVSFPGRTP